MNNIDSKVRQSNTYSCIQQKFKADECVTLDGANATELQRQGAVGFHLSDAAHRGFDSLDLAPRSVQALHKSYLDADRVDRASVAFGIGGDIETEEQLGTVELLLKVFDDAPPDLVLFETLSLVDENFTISAIEMLIEAGWPVWMSFRRCRYGVCGIHGQVRGGPEGDNFGRLANKLERCGIDALLINCQLTARVSGTIPWLRDFTNLPLGVYPNLGRHVDPNWLWKDTTGRTLSPLPLPLPEIVVNPGVLVPTQGSYLIWKYLLNSGVGGNSRCLDVGCGAGILAVQLALNGATEVVAIDFEKEAVANTMTNAFRNGVVESVKGEVVDPYVFDPDEKFDFIVTSLYQMPTDPKGKFSGHRAIDFWGRNLMEHFIAKLPDFLKDSGTAYVMHLSLPGQYRTASFLEQAGYQCVVLDFALYDFNSVFEKNLKQIERVEQLSDAYHFKFRNDNTMVMYLLEIRKKSAAK